MPMKLIKIVMLGAPGVGKSAIVQRFATGEFCGRYTPTQDKDTHYITMVVNDKAYHIKINDIPAIPTFPQNSLEEWTDYRYYGLLNADAYIMVFDVNSMETFKYIRSIREKIVRARSYVPAYFGHFGNASTITASAGLATGPSTGANSGASKAIGGDGSGTKPANSKLIEYFFKEEFEKMYNPITASAIATNQTDTKLSEGKKNLGRKLDNKLDNETGLSRQKALTAQSLMPSEKMASTGVNNKLKNVYFRVKQNFDGSDGNRLINNQNGKNSGYSSYKTNAQAFSQISTRSSTHMPVNNNNCSKNVPSEVVNNSSDITQSSQQALLTPGPSKLISQPLNPPSIVARTLMQQKKASNISTPYSSNRTLFPSSADELPMPEEEGRPLLPQSPQQVPAVKKSRLTKFLNKNYRPSISFANGPPNISDKRPLNNQSHVLKDPSHCQKSSESNVCRTREDDSVFVETSFSPKLGEGIPKTNHKNIAPMNRKSALNYGGANPLFHNVLSGLKDRGNSRSGSSSIGCNNTKRYKKKATCHSKTIPLRFQKDGTKFVEENSILLTKLGDVARERRKNEAAQAEALERVKNSPFLQSGAHLNDIPTSSLVSTINFPNTNSSENGTLPVPPDIRKKDVSSGVSEEVKISSPRTNLGRFCSVYQHNKWSAHAHTHADWSSTTSTVFGSKCPIPTSPLVNNKNSLDTTRSFRLANITKRPASPIALLKPSLRGSTPTRDRASPHSSSGAPSTSTKTTAKSSTPPPLVQLPRDTHMSNKFAIVIVANKADILLATSMLTDENFKENRQKSVKIHSSTSPLSLSPKQFKGGGINQLSSLFDDRTTNSQPFESLSVSAKPPPSQFKSSQFGTLGGLLSKDNPGHSISLLGGPASSFASRGNNPTKANNTSNFLLPGLLGSTFGGGGTSNQTTSSHHHNTISTTTPDSLSTLLKQRKAARKGVAQLVRKNWKYPYIEECSARKDWQISAIFAELLKAVIKCGAAGAPDIATDPTDILLLTTPSLTTALSPTHTHKGSGATKFHLNNTMNVFNKLTRKVTTA